MLRLWLVALCAGLLFAQEQEEEDGGITVDEPPAAGEPEPEEEPKPKAAGTAREPGAKAGSTRVKRKVFELTLPDDWVLEDREDPQTEAAWDVRLPGSERGATLTLARDENMLDPRSHPYHVAEWIRANRQGATAEVRPKPVPRILVLEGGSLDAHVYVRVRGNPYSLRLVCAPDDFAAAEPGLIAAAKSFTAEVEPWPPPPKGYETSTAGSFVVARAPAVTQSLAPLEKAVKAAEKRFRREHGALPKSDAPLVILVPGSLTETGKINAEAGKTTDGFYSDFRMRRLFTPVLAKGDAEKESILASHVHQHLFVAKYGDWRPEWIRVGEAVVARAEVLTGKALPSLHEGFLNWYSTLKLHKPDEMEAYGKTNSENWSKECFFLVAALRNGKFRKEYQAFLEDFAESADGAGAYERHLGKLDPEKVRAATHEYVRERIRSERPK